MSKFKVGDRVKAVKAYDGNYGIVNKTGVVIDSDGLGEIAVRFDKIINKGHSCGCKCESGHGWWCGLDVIVPVVDEKIVITTDGVTTTAKMYHGKTVVETATAKCNPDDEFDFDKGAKIAVDRLLGADVSKDNDDGFKVGDIVNIVNIGLSYTTYTKWITKNVKDVEKIAHFMFNEPPEENSNKYKIIAIAKHGGASIINKDYTLVYVERIGINKECYLMGVEGLKKC